MMNHRSHARVEVTKHWSEQLQVIENNLQQLALISNEPISEVYRSGASSYSDLKALIRANVPVCVSVMDTSTLVRSMLAEYAAKQGKLILDSGAFRVFKNNLKQGLNEQLDFNLIFERYAEVINGAQKKATIHFVCPDVVGEQQRSLELISEYLPQILELLECGASIIIPLQKGLNMIADSYWSALQKIPEKYHHLVVVGLPSNAKALSESEILSFLTTTQPRRVHFLGSSETKLIHKAQHYSSTTNFSCDANRIRKWIGQGRLLTNMHHSILDDAIEYAWTGSNIPHLNRSGVEFDFTEFLGSLTDYVAHCSSAELTRLAQKLCTTTAALLESCLNDELVEFIDSLNHGYSDHLLYEFHEQECRRKLSPIVRQYSITTLAQLGCI